MSPEEYDKLKEEAQTEALPLHLSILERAKETQIISIAGVNDTILNIEIRVMLNKHEVDIQSKFFNTIKNIQYIEDDYFFWVAASFLDMICIDPTLNTEFWRRDDVDPYIIQELIAAFIKNYM